MYYLTHADALMRRLVLPLLTLFLLTGCSSVKFSTAKEQYQRGEYYEAAQTLKQVYRKTNAKEEPEIKAEVSWYLGLCYDKLMIPAQSASGFMNARRYGYDDPTLLFRTAQQLHRNGKYREAEQLYKEHLELYPDDQQAVMGLESCQKAAEWKEAASRYEVKRFALTNTRRADFSPAIWGEKDEVLYWTSSADKSTGEEKSPITGTKYCDVWSLTRDENGKWGRPKLVEGSLNTTADEGTPSFSPDGNTMYYTASGGSEGTLAAPHIYVSNRSDASWGKGSMITFGKDTLSTIAHPAVSPDGKWLYFCSDMPGGEGGLDLWRAPLRSANEVGFAENLGPAINTPCDEMFPTFAPDGVLYFSTNGRETMGGLDIYSARLDEWDQWHLSHLGAPINSNADDFGMTFCHTALGTGAFPNPTNIKQEQEGWFASNRGQGKGYDNLYAFMLPSIKIRITGYVFDTDEEPVAEAIVRVVGRNGMNFKSLTKPDGSYEVSIDRSTEYVMMAGKQGYLNRKADLTSDPEEEDADYEVDFYLPSITTPVLIDNIFYDYNQARLREESYPSLDDLVQLLNDNPYTAIELAAHTDRVGSQNFNLDLSQRRAESVVDYLISQGIDEGRLTPVGYGKESPKKVDEKLHEQYEFLPIGQELDEDFVNSLEPAGREIADQINRRTEFQVISTTWGIE